MGELTKSSPVFLENFMLEKNITTPGTVLVGATGSVGKKVNNLAQLQARDEKLVKGRFNYLEVPGGILSFVYKAYKGQPVVRYDLKDGEIYRLPLGVAKHLNNNVGRIEHAYLLDQQGNPSKMTNRRVRRCTFENLEFMDIEEMGNTRIEEVTVSDLPPLVKH